MKQMDSLATSLRCIECGGASPLGYTLQCPTCGGLLELLYDEPRLRKLGTGAFTGTGLWRYAPVLPIADPAHRVSLGEGATPLLDCPRLARELGVQRLVVKFEGANPTGTVKDRSSATGVSAPVRPTCTRMFSNFVVAWRARNFTATAHRGDLDVLPSRA